MAKLFSSEVAVRICDEAWQLFGGYGFIKDCPVEKFYRDREAMHYRRGTSEIQRMIIAREVLKLHPRAGDIGRALIELRACFINLLCVRARLQACRMSRKSRGF